MWPAAPVAGSQIRTSPSSPAEASQDPSGATTNANTPPRVWPVRMWEGGPGGGARGPPPPADEGGSGGGQPGSVWGDHQRRRLAGVAGEDVAGGAGEGVAG